MQLDYGNQMVLHSLDGSSLQHPAIAQPGFAWEEAYFLFLHVISPTEPILPLKQLHRDDF